jgi:L-asparaginase
MTAQPGEAGIAPAIDANAWIERLPALHKLAHVQAYTLCLVASSSLGFEHVMDVLAWARAQVKEGATGLVITQGTDTLEETAYLLSLLWNEDAPLVLTGAMRGGEHPDGDAPENVLGAAHVALDRSTRGRGVMVVMHGSIHCASDVRKVNTLALDAFASPNLGPIGRVEVGKVQFHAPRPRRAPPLFLHRYDQRVALLETGLGEGPDLLEHALGGGYEGLVIAGFGAGHVPASWVAGLEQAARYVPVIVASRTGAGSTASHTYGFDGGEIDLQRRGVLMSGTLCPRKCRLLLWALLGAGALDQLRNRLHAG